ncbi:MULTISPECIES: lysoplasmalogenase [unclassified Leucobacter]|uniref:lysoplasmalogenase n=1 Tax=unclassified Leucobacter TaxID=2621730 RepID=UPI000A07CB44|nr:lysoplasmalogenase [Leucobacter sp. Ag1]
MTPTSSAAFSDASPAAREGAARSERAAGSAPSPAALLAWFAPYAIVSAVHVILRFAGHPLAEPTKLILMPALVLAVLGAAARIRPFPRAAATVLVIGVLASWLGDGAGTFFPTLPELPMMLACFGIAHLAYMWVFWRGAGIAVRPRVPIWAAAYALWWIVLIAVLGPHTGALLVPVALYGLVLGGTATLSSRCGPVVAWGGVWFLVSDSILAFRLFLPDAMPDWTSGMVMLTYCLGQGLIAAGVVRAAGRAADGAASSAGRAEAGSGISAGGDPVTR